MRDAFDQFWEWRDKVPESRLAIPRELYSAVMTLPEAERSSREAVNAVVEHRAELRRSRRTVWIYLNDYDGEKSRKIGDPNWIKLFGSGDSADRWLEEHDAEGVSWEYDVEGGQRQASIWIHLADENSRSIGDPAWARLFVSKEAAQNWLERNARNGKVWEYPVQE